VTTTKVCSGCGRKWGNRFFVCAECCNWDDNHLTREEFARISEVEGLRLSDEMQQAFAEVDRIGLSPEQRRQAIIDSVSRSIPLLRLYHVKRAALVSDNGQHARPFWPSALVWNKSRRKVKHSTRVKRK
jgi:hypothetical protein